MSAGDFERHVARRLRERRVALGLTQRALARQVGVSLTQIQKYESAQDGISMRRLYDLAMALEIAPERFIAGYDGADVAAPGNGMDERAQLEVTKFLPRLGDEEIALVAALVRRLARPAQFPDALLVVDGRVRRELLTEGPAP